MKKQIMIYALLPLAFGYAFGKLAHADYEGYEGYEGYDSYNAYGVYQDYTPAPAYQPTDNNYYQQQATKTQERSAEAQEHMADDYERATMQQQDAAWINQLNSHR